MDNVQGLWDYISENIDVVSRLENFKNVFSNSPAKLILLVSFVRKKL